MAELKYNISVLGYWHVGKTSMISSLFDLFDENIIPTRGLDYTTTEIEINKNKCRFRICDTIGGEMYRLISSTTIEKSDGFLLVFALDYKISFEEIKYWFNIIKEKVYIDEKPIILVGNKSDIINREISNEEVASFVKSNKLKYFETSAKNAFMVKEVFNELYQDIFNINNNDKLKKRINLNKNFINILSKYYKN